MNQQRRSSITDLTLLYMIYGSYNMGDMTELSYTNKIQLVRTTTSSMLSMPIVFAVSNEQGHTKDSTISEVF